MRVNNAMGSMPKLSNGELQHEIESTDQTTMVDLGIKLYRAVGPGQLSQIVESDWLAFPKRLAGQKFFYPQVHLEFAQWTALGWNVQDSGIAFVVGFTVSRRFLERYREFSLGGDFFREYRIPAEDLAAFNAALLGPIELVEEYHATRGTRSQEESPQRQSRAAVGF